MISWLGQMVEARGKGRGKARGKKAEPPETNRKECGRLLNQEVSLNLNQHESPPSRRGKEMQTDWCKVYLRILDAGIPTHSSPKVPNPSWLLSAVFSPGQEYRT